MERSAAVVTASQFARDPRRRQQATVPSASSTTIAIRNSARANGSGSVASTQAPAEIIACIHAPLTSALSGDVPA